MPADRLESMLESLPAPSCGGPPGPFMGAVRRRGRRRRAMQAAYAVALTLAASVATLIFVQPPEPLAGLPLASIQPDSIRTLTADAAAPDPSLPEASGGGTVEILRIGQRVDPEEVISWVSGL